MSDNPKKNYLKIIGIVFLIAVFCAVVIRVASEGIFSRQMGINIAVAGKNGVGLLILRPDEDMVSWMVLPKNLKISIYDSQAGYPIDSLWEYGVSEKRPYDIVQKSLGLSMGVIISRTVRLDENVSIESLLANLHKIGLKTNLSLRDRYLVRSFLATASQSKKILEIDVPRTVVDPIVEPDGREFLVIGQVMPLWTKNKFVLMSILSENVDVSINNLTDQPGLATQMARQLESAGMRVIEVSSDHANNIIGRGCVFVSDKVYPMSEELLVDHIGCNRLEGYGGETEKGIRIWLKS